MADDDIDTIEVRVTGRSFGYRGETYEQGETLAVEDSVLDVHPVTLDALDSDEGEGDTGDGDSQPVAEPPIDPSEFTVAELRDHLAADETDYSTDELDALADAERAGNNRETAIEAIDSVRDEDETGGGP